MLHGAFAESAPNAEIEIMVASPDAFRLMTEFCYDDEITIDCEAFIVLLHASEKYMMEDLQNICKKKLLAMNNINSFYLVMTRLGHYPASTCPSMHDDLLNSSFVKKNYKNIINNTQNFHLLQPNQVLDLFEFMNVHLEKYKTLKKHCKANLGDDTDWKVSFHLHFRHEINFDKLSMLKLTSIVCTDKMLTLDQAVELSQKKDELVKDLKKENENLKTRLEKRKKST